MMFTFIQDQTNWYNQKTDRFKTLKIEMLKETRERRYKLAIMRVKAIEQCKMIFNMAGAMIQKFGSSIDLKPFQEANKALISIENIIISDAKTKAKDLQNLQQGKVFMESRSMQGVCDERGFKDSTGDKEYKKEFVISERGQGSGKKKYYEEFNKKI